MTSSKRGLCWPVDNVDPIFTFTRPGSKISWLYNWSPQPSPNSSSLSFVPMQWNAVNIRSLASAQTSLNNILNANTTSSSSGVVLGFNEPERSDQANMSVSSAASAWVQHFEPLRRRGVRCGSPGISSTEDGILWLQQFLSAIRSRGSDVDFLCLHWYGENLGGFYDYLWSAKYRIAAEKNVWVTEFACTNWQEDAPMARADVENFARESVKYLDSLEWVERYAWFGAMRDTGTVGKGARMLDDDGKLTPLGKAYRDE